MSTLTIHGVDDRLEQAIQLRAAQRHQSASQWVVDALRHVLESDQPPEAKTYHDLDHLAGGWSAEETATFHQNIQIFEKIDEDVWA